MCEIYGTRPARDFSMTGILLSMYSSAILPDKCRCGQLIPFMFQSASLVFGGFCVCGVNVFRLGILGFDVMGYRPSLGHDFCLLASGESQDLVLICSLTDHHLRQQWPVPRLELSGSLTMPLHELPYPCNRVWRATHCCQVERRVINAESGRHRQRIHSWNKVTIVGL